MINLLPREQKRAITYAKYNRRIVGFVVFTVTFAVILIAGVFGLNLYSKRQLANVENRIAEKKIEIAKNGKDLKTIKQYQERIKKVNEIYDASPNFSVIMADIGQTLRPGVRIEDLSLNGDDTQPLSIRLVSESEKSGLESRMTLEASKRFSFVDIISTQQLETGAYSIELIAAYEVGEAS